MDWSALGRRLRAWLGRSGTPQATAPRAFAPGVQRSSSGRPAGRPEPWTSWEYLPEVPSVAWLRDAARGNGDEVRRADFARALLAVARDGDPTVRTATADILAAAPPKRLLAIDEELRDRWQEAPVWSSTLPTQLADSATDPLRLALAGCHPDGRIREAAVLRLTTSAHPLAAAVLALRCCDWVPQVRDRARGGTGHWRSAPPAGPVLVAAVSTAFSLRHRYAGEWLAELFDRLLPELLLASLEPLLAADDRPTRRVAYRAAIAAGRLDQARLSRAAQRDSDGPVRTLCARAAIQATVDPNQFQPLLSSRTALVRMEAVQALTVEGGVEVAVAALPDRHPLVRAIAQAALRRADADPAGYYRPLVTQPEPAPGAIAGLGETGRPDDAALILPCLSHPRARGRAAAIRALHRLGHVDPAELVPLLRDPSSAVTRQAAAALRRHVGVVDPARLEALLQLENPAHVRRAGYRLLTSGDDWLRLATNLRLVDDPDAGLRASARADITAWLSHGAARMFRRPDAARAAELARLIDAAQPVLGDVRCRQLRFHAGLRTSS